VWFFGYGSLMWDGWHRQFDAVVHKPAVLPGYDRCIDQPSTSNWGSQATRCPTAQLMPSNGSCTGYAFEVPELHSGAAERYIRRREGRHFELLARPVVLAGAVEVEALVALPKRAPAPWPLHDRALAVDVASGRSGSCREYLERLRTCLAELGVTEPAVDQLWQAAQERRSGARDGPA
jgi:cation transport protein ChaC